MSIPMPAAASIATRVSIENIPILPRIRSEMRGCETAKILAASV
jgi:hypothetical protein